MKTIFSLFLLIPLFLLTFFACKNTSQPTDVGNALNVVKISADGTQQDSETCDPEPITPCQ